jgi:hypothetical protein
LSDLATRTGSELASPEASKAANPLKMLPKEYRKPASFFFLAHSDTLTKGSAALCARLAIWIRDYRLTVADVKEIFRRVSEPGECEKFGFGAAQFQAALASHVRQHVARREAEAEAQRHREELAEFQRNMQDPEYRAKLEELFASIRQLTQSTKIESIKTTFESIKLHEE